MFPGTVEIKDMFKGLSEEELYEVAVGVTNAWIYQVRLSGEEEPYGLERWIKVAAEYAATNQVVTEYAERNQVEGEKPAAEEIKFSDFEYNEPVVDPTTFVGIAHQIGENGSIQGLKFNGKYALPGGNFFAQLVAFDRDRNSIEFEFVDAGKSGLSDADIRYLFDRGFRMTVPAETFVYIHASRERIESIVGRLSDAAIYEEQDKPGFMKIGRREDQVETEVVCAGGSDFPDEALSYLWDRGFRVSRLVENPHSYILTRR